MTVAAQPQRKVEDIYRLSPVQQGMLFHSIYAPESGVYFEQFTMRYGEGFDFDLFAEVWRRLIARHPILRTSFLWEELEEPVQVVHREAELAIDRRDWRELPAAEQEARLAAFKEADRRRGFDLTTAPLVRLAIIRTGEDDHRVIWSYHHLLLDGWSAGLVMNEVAEVFQALAMGVEPSIPERRPFRDYIGWLRKQGLDAAAEYWRTRLAGFAEPTAPDLGRPLAAPAADGEGYAFSLLRLSPAASARLAVLAREHRLTQNAFVQAAYAVLLARYSGRPDVVFGVTVSGRPPVLPGIDAMLGCFINTLPFRVRLDPRGEGESALGLAERINREMVELRKFEYSPLVEVRRWSELPHDRELFESIVVFESFTADAAIEMSHSGVFQRTNYPMTVVVSPGERMALRAGYDLARFDRAAGTRLLRHLRALLEQIAARPQIPIAELDPVPPGERHQVLSEWNDSAAAWPQGAGERCLHEIIADRAARSPDAVAVSAGSAHLTYAALRHRALALAGRLRRSGAGPGVPVAVSAERSLELMVGLLAVLEAGAAYVPLDPEYPADRLEFMLADSGAPVVLCQEALAPGLPATAAEIVLLDRPESWGAGEGASASPAAAADDPAYVIYTSGSTGRPKGAMNAHRGIVNRLLWMQAAYGLDGSDAVLQKTPASFDVSVWELFWPLMTGARLVMARPGGHKEPGYLVETIRRERVTTMHFVPSMLQVFLDAPGVEGCVSLRRVMASGEALPPELVARWHQRIGLGAAAGAALHNLYGPTEAAVDVTFEPTAPGAAVVPIGRPVANTAIHLLSRGGRPVPVGVPGELHIGGVQVAQGYLDRPALTAERFVPDPYAARLAPSEGPGRAAGARLYKTGDLARHLPDGRVEYLGRLDFQVKLRGFRIELGEIESALVRHPAVREAVVLARPRGERPAGAGGDLWLVAYAVPAEGEEPTLGALRADLGEALPEHMLPGALVLLGALPLTPNGKLDRRALPAPREPGADAGEIEPPRTPTEEILAGIWSRLLGVETVGRGDDFFELGGHSLLGTRLLWRVKEAFGVELPLRDLFEASTLAAAAARIDGALAGASGAPGASAATEPLRRQPRAAAGETVFPLTFAQERLWFLERLHPGTAVYNLPAAVRMEGELRADLLAAALAGVVARHETLRTRLVAEGEEAVQRVAPAGAVRAPLPVIDLSRLPAESARGAAHRAVAAVVRRPFTLAAAPLARAALVRLAADDHVLGLAVHHIVSDGWSMGVLVRDVAELYAARASGREPRLPELAVGYGDFALWQREHLAGERLDAQVAFWRERLAGLPDLLPLPTDRPRPAIQTYRGAYLGARLAGDLRTGLEALGREAGATLFMSVLAAFQALLFRWSGEDDVAVGTPVAGRSRPEVEDLIGFFVNTLVLRGDLSARPSFRDLQRQARERTLAAHAHQDVPFEHLVEKLAPRRALSHSPLFQVMLAFQEPSRGAELPGLAVTPFGSDTATAKYDLTLYVTDAGDDVALAAEYNPDLFEAATVRRLVGHLDVLLRGAVAAPETPVDALPLLTAAERAQATREWNDTAVPEEEATLPERIAARALRTPDAIAVVGGDEALSYRELLARVDRLAARVRAASGGAGQALVGICLERSPALVVATLAVMRAGGAYVPLDPAHPADRIRYALEDSGARVLISDRPSLAALAAQLPEGIATVGVDDDGDERAGGADPAGAAAPSDPAALAYVIYTSGSTGRPKGVAVSHRALVNFMTAMAHRPGMAAADALLAVTTLSFDIAGLELFLPLLAGGRTVIAGSGESADPRRLRALLAVHRITVMQATPATWRLLTETGWEGAPELTALCGGEALPPELAAALAPRVGRLWNMYGPTETTIWSGALPVDGGRGGGPTPVGGPIANTTLEVTDSALGAQPVGVPGELAIGGAGLARGYVGRPGLTAERFVPDPFAAAPGARLYKTGDLVRRAPGGEIAYLGRLDHQVKVRGFRIELGEIEAALDELPAIRQAVVMAVGEGDERRLAAYVVPAGHPGSPAPELADVRAALGRSLPDYMLPAALVALPEMPLNPSGKADRRALAALGLDRGGAARAGRVAPRTPLETTLAGIWAEVLGVEEVGVEDDFFALGGHSLLGTRVMSRVEAAVGVELPLMALFRHPTVAALAAALEAAAGAEVGEEGGTRKRASATAAEAIPRAPRDGSLVLSFAQERLWFLDRFEPDSPLYNLPAGLTVRGRLDAHLLQGALDDLARRHETLRTTFTETSAGPAQVVAPRGSLPLAVIDLCGLAPAPRHRLMGEVAHGREARRPFDLARGPVARVRLLRLGPEEHEVLLTVHHIASDGASEAILVRDLLVSYARRAGLAAPELPALPVQYADFAAWQRRRLTGETLEREVALWRDRLAGAPALLELPTDRPRPPAQTFRGGTRPVRLGGRLSNAVRERARELGATPFMVLLAAYAALLGRLTGQDDIVVGSPVEGRLRPELEELVGFFVNTLALRTDLAGDPSFAAAVARARAAALEAFAHQEVPFEKLVEELAPARNLAYTPLFQVMLILQPAASDPAPASPLGVSLTRSNPASGISKFDLTLNLFETEDGFIGQWVYATDLFDAATIDRISTRFATLLGGALAAPEAAVSRLPLLTAEERRQLLVDWNRPAVEHSSTGFVHEMVAAQAARTPDAVAVVFGAERLSYRELDRRTDRLAARLRAAGVGPEQVVGVFAERSADLPTALLAVLRAGAAYLPLDPELPAERLRFLLADAAVPAVVAPAHLAARLAELAPDAGEGPRVIALDGGPVAGEEGVRKATGPGAGPRATDPDHPAYVIYTSGSTGRPKGVVVPHRALGNRLEYARAADIGPADAFLQKTTISFDVSVLELFGPLVAGGRTVLPVPGGEKDTAYLVELIARERITQTSFPPTLLLALLDEPRFRELGSLRTVITGGETVPPELPPRFFRHLGADLLNRYGPTEATISVTSWRCLPERDGRALPIGRPTAGARVYVLDRGGEPVPAGVAGEVYLGGPCVARGYLGRPRRTAESFVPDPFAAEDGEAREAPEPGARLYKTGDLARYRPDGALEFAGRVDSQIKIRGFRVELGEIEAVLARHPGVREVAVAARGEGQARSLAAYVVEEDGGAGGLEAFAAEHLPAYMVPAAFVRLDALPLSPTGKVDRDALPEPESRAAGASPRYAPPSGPVEELVAALWAELLDVERVGRDDSFFDLGGHSLLATRVVSRLRESFRIELPLRTLFEQPTVAELARAIASAQAAASIQTAAGAAGADTPPLVALSRPHRESAESAEPAELPLSFAQERLWFVERLLPGTPVFHIANRFRLAGSLDAGAFGRSLALVAARHETLRTGIVERAGAAVQRIAPAGDRAAALALARVDLRGLPAARREAEAGSASRAHALAPFDLGRAPLARAILVTLDEREHLLGITLHHIVADGWSMGVLVDEVTAAYRALVAGERPALPPLPVQYGDYAAWQRRRLSGAALDEQLGYWRERLAGAPPLLELPTDRPRSPRQRFDGSFERFSLPAATRDRLHRLARAEGTTLFMILLAALQALFFRWSGQGDVVVGTPIAGRTRREVEGLIGFFLNNLALRTEVGTPRASASSSPGCGRPHSAPSPTRSCRSRSWSRRWRQRATCRTRRSSSTPWCSRTRRRGRAISPG